MKSLDLNGAWSFGFADGKKLEECPESIPACDDLMAVPGAFDATPRYYCRRGTARYRREFELDAPVREALLTVDGMGLRGRFLIDGREIGRSASPYSALEFSAGALAEGKHTVEAWLDNTFDDEKLKLFLPYYDFYAYGGFYYGMSLKLRRAESEIDEIRVRTRDIGSGSVELEFCFGGTAPAAFEPEIRFDTESSFRKITVKNGRVRLDVPRFKLWSPEHPHLHSVVVRWNGDESRAVFGIRAVTVGDRRILLNGEPVYLKGFNRHEAHPEFGPATPEPVMIADLQHLRELNCNFIRGCHYRQNGRFLDLCDRLGFLVWEESLGWGNQADQMADPEYIALQVAQTRDMVRRSINHPCVIISGFQNENDSSSEAGLALNTLLVRTIRAEDSGRLVTFACSHTANDISNAETDIIAYNTYPGWIDPWEFADPERIFRADRDRIVKYFRDRYGAEKPIMVSEMGACGMYGAHDTAGAQWSEEFQADYLDVVIRTVFESEDICGLCLWQLNDAKSFCRSGGRIRTKPMALNMGGSFDSNRRPKLAAEVVRKRFAELPASARRKIN